MEELELTDPVVKPEEVVTKYKVNGLNMDMEGATSVVGVLGFLTIKLKDNLGGYLYHTYEGQTAIDYMKFINTANFSTKSLNKRILERLSTEGIIPGTVVGAPDGTS